MGGLGCWACCGSERRGKVDGCASGRAKPWPQPRLLIDPLAQRAPRSRPRPSPVRGTSLTTGQNNRQLSAAFLYRASDPLDATPSSMISDVSALANRHSGEPDIRVYARALVARSMSTQASLHWTRPSGKATQSRDPGNRDRKEIGVIFAVSCQSRAGVRFTRPPAQPGPVGTDRLTRAWAGGLPTCCIRPQSSGRAAWLQAEAPDWSPRTGCL